MFKQLKIFFFLIGYSLLVMLFIGLIAVTFYLGFHLEYVFSVLIFLLFFLIAFKTRSKGPTTLTLLVFVVSFIGVILDTQGNELFNKPLEWIFNNSEETFFIYTSSNLRGGYSYHASLPGIESDLLSAIILYVYRFFQYAILYAVVGFLIRRIPVRKMPKEKPFYLQDLDSTGLTEAEKEQVVALIKEKQKVKAMKFITNTKKMSLKASKKYVDWLEAQMLIGMYPKVKKEEKEETSQPEAEKTGFSSLSEADKEEIVALIKEKKKVKAIKLIREKLNISLKEAKKYADSLELEIIRQ